MSTYESLSLIIDFGEYTIAMMALIISIQALRQTKK
ncbi:putative holin-like toxin [Paenibacillus sp. FSL L8-0708]